MHITDVQLGRQAMSDRWNPDLMRGESISNVQKFQEKQALKFHFSLPST